MIRVLLNFWHHQLQWCDLGKLSSRGKRNLWSAEVSLVSMDYSGHIGQNPHLGSLYMWQEADVQLFYIIYCVSINWFDSNHKKTCEFAETLQEIIPICGESSRPWGISIWKKYRYLEVQKQNSLRFNLLNFLGFLKFAYLISNDKESWVTGEHCSGSQFTWLSFHWSFDEKLIIMCCIFVSFLSPSHLFFSKYCTPCRFL